jgi:hypothetical protein
MALQANDILKVVVSILLPDSVVAQNIFWVLFEADGGSVDDDDVLDDLEDWIELMYEHFLSSVGVDVVLDDLKAYVYDSGDDDFDEVGDRTLEDSFVAAGDLLPHGVAAVSNADTINPDVTGRKFWCGFVEGVNEDGYLVGDGIIDVAFATGIWVAPFDGTATGSGFVPGVYSLTKSIFYPFNLNVANNILLGYQRRRKPGVGI